MLDEDDFWAELTDAAILVSGASGFLGSAIVAELARRRQAGAPPVTALCRNPSRQGRLAELGPAVETAAWEMEHPLERRGRNEMIIHAAACCEPAVIAANPAAAMRANMLGCLNLLEYAKRSAARKFVFISSTDVYGSIGGDGRIDENEQGVVSPLNPRSAYTLSKMTGEAATLAYGRECGLPVGVARLSHTYGPGSRRDDTRVSARFALLAAEGRDIVMKSPGDQLRSLCYVSDAVAGVCIVLARGENGQVYNVASEDSESTVRRYAEKLAEIGGASRVVFSLPDPAEQAAFSGMAKSVFSSAKLRKLGWRPRVGLDEGIRNTLAYFRSEM